MKLIYYWSVFSKMPWSFKKMLLITAWQSFLMEINLKFNRNHIIQAIGVNRPETIIDCKDQRILIRRTHKIIQILEKRAPWKPNCYNKALTAKSRLRAANIETTLHIGFKPRQLETTLEGHAWLTVDDFIITGSIPQLHLYKELHPISKK